MGLTVLGAVPARMQSRRFPGKVLKEVAGKPLVIHAFERLSGASLVREAFVATDSPEVERAASDHGAPVIRVDEPCASGSDRVARALRGLTFDAAVNLQADQPLVDPRDIDRLVKELAGDESLDLATLAYLDEDEEAFASRDTVKTVIGDDGQALYFSRAPIPSSKDDSGNALFLHHVGIYCFRRAALERFAALPMGPLETRESLEQLRALEAGMRIGVLLADSPVPDVDRPSDIAVVERALDEGRR
ncbi:MAG: 3-deoxy-manno-octulosonate cytidylyltransferase [Candidatus Eisenbacteria bacterium]|nr:3-deoxy-manno-octulosonate cytidylyltransferase [Candidatus Eisenbacteria bacterium]